MPLRKIYVDIVQHLTQNIDIHFIANKKTKRKFNP